ncbi:MAG: AAA family ATPase [Deltaproteobacteria bacterium]|jgi:hypothetical protein|nr:AAA family ATPase [Deltaproteobacteria bacterium]
MRDILKVKGLPLGNQSFTRIIDRNLLYDDKTKYIYDLIRSSENNYFLSRPRRFGKTLLLSTIKEVFSGNRQRFKNLWIGQSDYDFPKHPVLSLSMSMSSESPEILKTNLLCLLRNKANKAKISIKAPTPDTYFANLIEALYEKYGLKDDSGVVVLIDEYDAPVTRNMDNLEVAQANAKILHDFFAVLKTDEVADSVHFTLVTGITRYALTSMDSGPNHLNDISLDARYSGICGFSVDGFESLFTDLMAPTLEKLKEKGKFRPSAGIKDLMDEIKDWYDGYNWGGETRILNPYSILHFFKNSHFARYWTISGRPAHLTALIKAKPDEFIDPEFQPKPSDELRKAELTHLQALPVLFHSGYLTIDKIMSAPSINAKTKKSSQDEFYTFKYPNFEVSGAYREDIYYVIFGADSKNPITKGKEILGAILTKNAEALETIFSNYFSSISYHQRPTSEKTFHAYVHFILTVAGFKVRSELPGAKVRLDFLVELEDRVYVIIELKFQQNPTQKLTQAERNAVLARLAKNQPSTKVDARLAISSLRDKYDNEIDRALYENRNLPLSDDDRNHLIAEIIKSLAPAKELNVELAKLALNTVAPEYIQAALSEASVDTELTSDRLDLLLAKGAEKALEDITARNYRQVIGNEAKRIIDLGMAIYDHGAKVKVVFGQK